MTANQFRKLALSLPSAQESEHQGHPDFRVGGKIFATLGPDNSWGMVKLSPVEQTKFISESDLFTPASGAWGKNGATVVTLRGARTAIIKRALMAAWKNTAPRSLLKGDE